MSTKVQRSISRLGQQCGKVDVRNGAPFFNLVAGAATARDAGVGPTVVARMLGCDERDLSKLPIEVCSGGLPWLIVKLRSIDVARTLAPDLSLVDEVCRACEATGVTTYCDGADLSNADHHVRTFAPSVGIPEDPACGSGNIAVAIHMARHCHPSTPVLTFACEQGLELDRAAVLHLDLRRSSSNELVIRLGGHAARVMEGRLVA